MMMRMALRGIAVAAVLLASAAPALVGQRLLPERRLFRSPLADPFTPRLSVGIQQTNLLATQGPERPPFFIADPDDSASDVVAAVGIGLVFPLLELGEDIILFADARVFSRFRIEYDSRDDMGQDWFVGGGIEMRDGAMSGRAAIMHRSSHLGDEFVAATGARRIEFGGEQLDLLLAWDAPRIARIYGGGSWIFRSYLDWEPLLAGLDVRDRVLLQLGADQEWRLAADPRFSFFGGLDVQTAERTGWDVGFAAAAGFGIRTARSFRIMARFYDGPSTMGEFFLTPERYYILELVAEI